MEKNLRILLLPVLLFIVFYTIVSVNNRFASDDFEFLNKLRDYGWPGSVKWFHEHWNTRWSSIAILNGVLLIASAIHSLWWYHLLCLSLLWYAAFRIIRNLNIYEYSSNALLAGFFSVSFFYSSFSIPDVFFWINTSSMYLLGCIAFLFAIGEITTSRHTVACYLRLSVFSVFIAGSYEPLVFTLLICAVFILIFLVRKHGWKVWYFPFDKKIIIMLSGLMLGFAISYAGEGHVVRSAFLPQTTVAFKLFVWIKAIMKMFVIFLPQIIPAFILGALPWMLIPPAKIKISLTKNLFFRVTLLYVLLIIVSLLPVAFVMSEMGPERAWTQISMYTVIYSVLTGIYFRNLMPGRYDSGKLHLIFAIASTIFILLTGIPAARKSFEYSSAYDNRMQYLKNKKQPSTEAVLTLPPLPVSGWLHSAEIDTSPSHFTNRFLKEYMNLNSEIRKDAVGR